MLARTFVKRGFEINRETCWRRVISSSEQNCKKSSEHVKFSLPKAFFVGSFAGFLGSLAGMGGGFVMIPLMTSRLLKLSQHQAHGTSLFAVATTGIAGAMGYSGQLDLEAAATIALCGMFTARLGASITAKLSEKVLKQALGFYMVMIAPVIPAKEYFNKNKSNQKIQSSHSLVERIIPSAGIGLGSGFLAGLFGVGGGAVVVPALTLATDLNHYQALGTSLCAMTLPAVVGTATHFSKNNIALRIAPSLAIGSFLGAYAGSKLGLGVDENILRYGFSSLMLALGIKTLLKA